MEVRRKSLFEVEGEGLWSGAAQGWIRSVLCVVWKNINEQINTQRRWSKVRDTPVLKGQNERGRIMSRTVDQPRTMYKLN